MKLIMVLLHKLFNYKHLRAAGLAGLLGLSSIQFGCEQGGSSSNDSDSSTNYSGKANSSDNGPSSSTDSGSNDSTYSGGSGMMTFDVNGLSGTSCYVSTRGNASGAQTLHFSSGSSASGSVGLKPNTAYDVVARYSDNDGLSNVQVAINGSTIGAFTTVATRGAGEPNGTGWNVFTTAGVGSFTTDSSGNYLLQVTSDGDSFGVDMDTLTFAEK